jgi:hypothetical protein
MFTALVITADNTWVGNIIRAELSFAEIRCLLEDKPYMKTVINQKHIMEVKLSQ